MGEIILSGPLGHEGSILWLQGGNGGLLPSLGPNTMKRAHGSLHPYTLQTLSQPWLEWTRLSLAGLNSLQLQLLKNLLRLLLTREQCFRLLGMTQGP